MRKPLEVAWASEGVKFLTLPGHVDATVASQYSDGLISRQGKREQVARGHRRVNEEVYTQESRGHGIFPSHFSERM